MFRLILLAVIGFFVYRIVQSTARIFSSNHHESSGKGGSASDLHVSPPGKEFRNVQDAEFEDIPPKKENEGSPSDPVS